ncbi:DUF3040 domain-containing protein [Streptomyces sp. NPDC058308]|uniref:DUF3040 domain-containing protein n=1 Tax=Streptomyces sp. NPDC058308 TaxID=3346440 RepID=UPI0036E542D9
MSAERLPEHEQRILDALEASLRTDRHLRARWWLLRLRHRVRTALTRAPRPRTVALLSAVCGTLLVTGIHTCEPGLIWAFAGLWSLTLVGFVRLLCRWTDP